MELEQDPRPDEGPKPPSDSAEGFKAFAAQKSKPAKTWQFALKLAASIGLLAFILSRADLAQVRDAVLGVDVRWIALAIALQFVGVALISYRWRGLLAAQNVTPGWPYLFRSTLISGFFRQFMPSTIGGDVIRGYDAWRAGAGVGLAFVSLVLDRLFGLIALAILALAALTLSPETAARLPGISLWVGFALVAVLGAVCLLVIPQTRLAGYAVRLARFVPGPVRNKLVKMVQALTLYHNARGVLLRSLLVSLALQVNVVTFYWAIAMALHLPVGYGSFFAIAPLAIFVMMVPLSINGIGIREGIFVFLLAQWGVSEPQALALAWVEYGLFLGFGLLGGVLYGLRRL